jgi:hypothetical protein
MVYETVSAIQEAGVIATTKHLIAQEQETHRLSSGAGPFQEAVSSNVDDKTMHELYLWYAFNHPHLTCIILIEPYSGPSTMPSVLEPAVSCAPSTVSTTPTPARTARP